MSATEIDPEKLEAVMGQAVLDMGETGVIKEGGFASVRRATETPFNLILEAKP